MRHVKIRIIQYLVFLMTFSALKVPDPDKLETHRSFLTCYKQHPTFWQDVKGPGQMATFSKYNW